jgi:hypothetical protein
MMIRSVAIGSMDQRPCESGRRIPLSVIFVSVTVSRNVAVFIGVQKDELYRGPQRCQGLVSVANAVAPIIECLARLYSFRRATTGSTRAARRAGTKHARAATPSRIRDTALTVGT